MYMSQIDLFESYSDYVPSSNIRPSIPVSVEVDGKFKPHDNFFITNIEFVDEEKPYLKISAELRSENTLENGEVETEVTHVTDFRIYNSISPTKRNYETGEDEIKSNAQITTEIIAFINQLQHISAAAIPVEEVASINKAKFVAVMDKNQPKIGTNGLPVLKNFNKSTIDSTFVMICKFFEAFMKKGEVFKDKRLVCKLVRRGNITKKDSHYAKFPEYYKLIKYTDKKTNEQKEDIIKNNWIMPFEKGNLVFYSDYELNVGKKANKNSYNQADPKKYEIATDDVPPTVNSESENPLSEFEKIFGK